MDYEALLELSVDLAYELQYCGGETYRVEDTVTHLLGAYGLDSEVFAIPNCIIASIETPDGRHLNRMRRSRSSSNNLEGLERYNALCRRLCQEKLPVEEARRLFEQARTQDHGYRPWVILLAHFIAGFGFSILFGGCMMDALIGGLCGVAVGLCNRFASALHANVFFRSLASGFVLAFLAHSLFHLGLGANLNAAISGPMMLLVPGLLFTNSVRDIIYGDSLSGVNRLVQVLIIAVALAVGTGAAAALATSVWGSEVISDAAIGYSLFVECLVCAFASAGFCIIFNIHGPGMGLCLIGGTLSWCAYRFCADLGLSDPISFLIAASLSAMYAEIMARLRRCPSTGYLITALFPLIPGSHIYQTMVYAIHGDTDGFMTRGTHTAALAGALAIGILLISTLFRMWAVWRSHRRKHL